MSFSKKFAVAALAVSLGLVGCQADKKPADNAKVAASESVPAQKVEASKTTAPSVIYNVATLSSFPPFVLSDEKGKAAGFDMEVLNAIGEKEGFGLNYVILPWDGMLDGLNAGKHDIVATGVVMTAERKALYDFSDPYLDMQWSMLLKEDAAKGKPRYKTYDEALGAIKTVTSQTGAAGLPALKQAVSHRSDVTITEVDSPFLEIQNVVQGKVDAAYDISPVFQYYAQTPDLKSQNLYVLMNENSPKEYLGYAVKKGRNDDLLKKINSGLAKIKADGTYDKIHEKWFHVQAASTTVKTEPASATASGTKAN